MKKVFLHIGMHKTGSSSIQEALACLRSNDFTYCDFMHPNQSMAFYTLFSKNYLNYHEWQKQGYAMDEIIQKRQQYLEILNKYLWNREYQNLIFSAESISLLKDDEKRDMINFFKDYKCEITIICYVREPLSFAYSSFQQDIKSGSSKIKEKYSPNYIFRIEEFRKNPMIDNLVVRDFTKFKDNNIVSDFFYILGLNYKYNNNYHINKSLSISALKVIFFVNKRLSNYHQNLKTYEARLKFINLIEETFKVDNAKYEEYFNLKIDYEEISYLRENFRIYYIPQNNKKSDDLKTTLNRLENFSDIDHSKLNILAKNLGISTPSEKLQHTVIDIFEFLLKY